MSDLRSRGRGFESRLGTRRRNSGQVYHTYVPLSPSSISWYWPKGGNALRLGSKGRYGSCVGGRYLSTLEITFGIIKRYTNGSFTLLYFTDSGQLTFLMTSVNKRLLISTHRLIVCHL